MRVSVTGPLGGNVPFDLAVEVQQSCQHYAQQLGMSRLHTEILVRIHKQNVIDGDAEGLCDALTPRMFVIDVCLYGNWLSTLAHEMVHVKQWARNEMDLTMERWKTRDYCGNIDYWNQPWEREARWFQHRMVSDYANNPGNPTLLCA